MENQSPPLIPWSVPTMHALPAGLGLGASIAMDKDEHVCQAKVGMGAACHKLVGHTFSHSYTGGCATAACVPACPEQHSVTICCSHANAPNCLHSTLQVIHTIKPLLVTSIVSVSEPGELITQPLLIPSMPPLPHVNMMHNMR